GRAGGAEGVRAVVRQAGQRHPARERLSRSGMAIETVDTRLRRRRNAEALGLAARLRRLDWVLLAAVVALALYGLYAVDGITKHDGGGSALSRQMLYAAAGALIFAGALLVDPARYRRFAKPLYFGTLGLMLLVLGAGAASHGSRRWIDIGFFAFQPSEFGKVLFVLALAGLLADRSVPVSSARAPLRAVGYGLAAIALVFVQPDFGTALVYSAALAGVLFVAGVRWLHLALLGAATVIGALAILWFLPAA